MTGAEFVRAVRALARRRGLPFQEDTRRGKGSHRILYMGARRTTVKDPKQELGKGLLRQMCRDLGITLSELE
jgi:predicted RNA binding protein YcfA (HicA-like mRNA interferase family)